MRITPSLLLSALSLVLLFNSCTSEKEDLQIVTSKDFFSLQKGKYIIYRTDSLVFTQAGRSEETHSYQEKHLIDDQISDNLGRPAHRVFKLIRDVAGLEPWRPSGSYFITPLSNTVEIVEDNLRVIKLVTPVKAGTTWKGNRYLSSDPYAQKFSFSIDDDMANWDFLIDSSAKTLVLNGKKIEGVTTVSSVNEARNVPVTDAASYAERRLYIEKFALGIGLVYQEYILWEYQPNPGSTGYKVGFGIKRSMIDRN